MTSELIAFTEYEEEISFDVDDPDFAPGKTGGSNLRTSAYSCSLQARVPSPMSLAGVHPMDVHSAASVELISRSQSFGALSAAMSPAYGSLTSLEDVHQLLSHSEQAVVSIEELRLQLNSCFTCGVSWQQEHVSLDCSECGGYSLERPCPRCDGQCDNIWKRDLTMTHACRKARWQGECGLQRTPQARLLMAPLPRDLPLTPEGELPAFAS